MAYNYIPHNVNGTFKNSKPFVKVSGTWRECEEAYVNVNGVWKKAFKNIIEHTSSGTRYNANIDADFGYPSEAGDYIWTNNGDCRSAGGSYGVITGGFPAGSTLTIINNGYIRGRGGNGGSASYPGAAGHTALYIQFPTTVQNASGYIWGGGGGGGSANRGGPGANSSGGGGGAGSNAGSGGSATNPGAGGTLTSGGSGGSGSGTAGGNGGGLGAGGGSGSADFSYSGGSGGRAIQKNGNSVTIVSGYNSTRIKGSVS